ncbi:hypothetical protein ACFL6S_15060 [Candidatus Poribacteria bacterium]
MRGILRQGDKESRGQSGIIVHFPHTFALFFALFAIIIVGCGESPFEEEDSVPVEMPGALSALDFPTADGSLWEYVSVDEDHTYTVQINGIRNLGGSVVRIQESDSETPVTQLGALYGLPIRNSLFIKDLDAYTEHAFEFWLANVDDTVFHRNLPKRVLWSFPLYVGKEWESIFSEWLFGPEIIYTRKVVSDKNIITVPAGIFDGVYYVEEQAPVDDLLPDSEEIPPNKYWIAPGVGIIKYEFLDPFFNVTVAYELRTFEKGG